jgi:uncharacterized protein (TIGR02300 family)
VIWLMNCEDVVGEQHLIPCAPHDEPRSIGRQNTMPTKAVILDLKARRGTKRTCQNGECGSHFYDLNRDPITCPVCGTAYVLGVRPAADEPVRATTRIMRKSTGVRDETKPEASSDEVADEALVANDEEAAHADDETFLEEVEEDSPDVTTIVDAPIERDEKT